MVSPRRQVVELLGATPPASNGSWGPLLPLEPRASPRNVALCRNLTASLKPLGVLQPVSADEQAEKGAPLAKAAPHSGRRRQERGEALTRPSL